MKLTNNHKILLGLVVGGGVAWLLSRRNSSSASTDAISSSAPEELSREDKVDFIIENIGTSNQDESSGFSGERFEYDPRLGYALPIGKVQETRASSEMTLMKEGNLANEVFFNADGEETDDPVEEAESILSELTDQELNIAFKVARARKNNPNLNEEALIKIANLNKEGQGIFLGLIKEKMNDVKGLQKSPNWKKGIARRQEMRQKMKGMSKDERKAFRMTFLENLRAKRKARRQERRGQTQESGMKKRPARASFKDEIINRQSGAMWGGYRNDGLPTNADARTSVKARGQARAKGRA